MNITLEAWAKKHFDPVPSLWTLRRMARERRIYPRPVKVGKFYMVQEDARPVDPTVPLTLLERLQQKEAA